MAMIFAEPERVQSFAAPYKGQVVSCCAEWTQKYGDLWEAETVQLDCATFGG